MNRIKAAEAPPYDTLVVNLLGGPGAGKSTLAHRLCADLAMGGKLVEDVPEFAKELIWQDRRDLLNGSIVSQAAVTGEQMARVDRLSGKVEIVVTDSPALLGLAYTDPDDPDYAGFADAVVANHRSQRRLDVFVNRSDKFDMRGRKHTLEQSLDLDRKIRAIHEEASGAGLFEYYRNDAEASNYQSLFAAVFAGGAI